MQAQASQKIDFLFWQEVSGPFPKKGVVVVTHEVSKDQDLRELAEKTLKSLRTDDSKILYLANLPTPTPEPPP